jgi:hypothetical protein
MKRIRSCVTPEGKFIYGIHKPQYSVTNLRTNSEIQTLGHSGDGTEVNNIRNFPDSDVAVENADWIFEIPNPFPFKGVTYIDKEWADASANNYGRIRIPQPEHVSFSDVLEATNNNAEIFGKLPEPMLLALATCSTDSADLTRLAEISCEIEKNGEGIPTGLAYTQRADGSLRARIHKHLLFEAVANNPCLPDPYKIAMVIRPGAQGGSEIIGEIQGQDETHVYEYLRRNSYIAGGHYAANMAEDAIRYSIDELSANDMNGLRHLYYQRTYIRLATELGIELPGTCRQLTPSELEELRQEIVQRLQTHDISATATLWGWNFGFDYAPSKYRLHASHQQIHQQYAMIPDKVDGYSGNLHTPQFTLPAYGCGDMIADVMQRYRAVYDRDFFVDYFAAIENNKRMDERDDLESSLVIWRDKNVMVFVPKAQTSQWEVQLMTLESENGYPVGNIIEANSRVRDSLNAGILMAQKALAGIGAKMVTSIEYPKRIGRHGEQGQPLLYAFLPRLPESPGAFSEAQLRFINGHYPEDFAAFLREQLRV